jgi:hypothetical protein
LAAQTDADVGAWRARTVIGLVFGGLWFLVLIGVLFVITEAPTRAMTGIALVAGVVGVVFAQVRYPRVAPRHGQTIMVLLLVVDVALTLALGGFAYHRAHRPIDVTAAVTLSRNLSVLPGQSAALDLAIVDRRSTLDVVFRVSDHNPETGICAPQTELRITPLQNGNRGEPISVEPGAHVRVPVLAAARSLHLEVEVRNVRQDNGCAVDIAVTSARLTSG